MTRALYALLVAVALFIVSSGVNLPSAFAAETAPIAPVIAEVDAFIAAHPIDKTRSRWRTRLRKPPMFKFDPAKTYTWKLETSVGEIQFRFLDDIAPMHVSSTLYLTRVGFYDTLKFHRIIAGFMAQGGDPLGRGTGSPGYKYSGEYSPLAIHDSAGTLSMANSGPGTDGSQFFITFGPTPHLNNKHTVFGKAESKKSLATIKKMESLARPRGGPPLQPITITKATILIE